MKKLIIIFILSAFAIVGLDAQEMTKKSKDNFTVKVDGLGCAFCAYGLEKKFKELDGIKKIAIDLETGTLTFTRPSTEKMDLDAVKQQVNSAGYTFINAEVERFDGVWQHVEKEAKKTVQKGKTTLTFEAIKVSGNCGMCKSTIEKTAHSFDAVETADWNTETKVLIVEFDASQLTLGAIENAIAKAGYTTEHINANASAYENLPDCCKYKE